MREYRWAELNAGQTAEFEAEITNGMIDSFRALSGDVNPLHSDESLAKERGFRGTVAHGMLVASLYSRLVGVHLPGLNCLLHEIKVTFSSPAYAGDRLRVMGEVTYLNAACRQMEIKARIERASELISRAVIKVGVHE